MKKHFLLTIMMLFALGAPIMAQGAPDQINSALSNLSSRIGRTISLSDLDNWSWAQELYPDTSLGCPETGMVYAQVQTVGYRFELTYAGVIYDYRVSGDSTIVILCASRDVAADEASVPTAPTDDYTNPLCPPPNEGEPRYMRTRVAVNTQAQVTTGSPNRVRADGTRQASEIGQIPPGALFSIIGGPKCADGILWWNINYDGLIGWTAEGEAGEYFIEPLLPRLLPPRQVLSDANIVMINELARLQGNLGSDLAWSPTSEQLIVSGGFGSDSLWVYDIKTLNQTPRILNDDEQILSVAYRPGATQAIIGTAAGTIHLLSLAEGETLVERLFLQSHVSDIASIHFHPDGVRVAVAGLDAVTNAPVERTNAIVIWNVETVSQTAVLAGHPAIINELAFNADGSRLASVSADGTLIIWDTTVNSMVKTIAINTPLSSIAYSPNSQFIATGTADGRVILLDAQTGDTITNFTTTSPINTIAFSPDNTLLIAGSEDGIVRVWSTVSDQLLASLTGDDAVRDVAFSPNGTLISALYADATLRLWGVPQS